MEPKDCVCVIPAPTPRAREKRMKCTYTQAKEFQRLMQNQWNIKVRVELESDLAEISKLKF